MPDGLPRNLMMTVMEGGIPDRIPYSIGLPRRFYERLRDEIGREPSEAYHLDNGVRGVGRRVTGKPPWDVPFDEPPDVPDVEAELWERFRAYLPDIDGPGRRVTEYGVMTILGGFHHLRRMYHPMADLTSPAELEQYPWPDTMAQEQWADATERSRQYLDEGYYVSAGVGSIFENSWFLRGQEQLLIDLHENPEFAEALLDRVTEIQEKIAVRLARMGVHCIGLGDDMGVQHGLIMSLPMLRKWILSRWERVIASAKQHQPDLHVNFHTDGKMQEAIPDLMAIGVTAINPVQPECDDPDFLKRTFGRKLVLFGTLSSRVLTFGRPEEIRAEIKVRMETGKRWGGLVLTPNNAPDVNTPYENFVAFLDAAEQYGGLASWR